MSERDTKALEAAIAGATLYRLRKENGELRAKVERLELLLGMQKAMDQIDAAMQEEDG